MGRTRICPTRAEGAKTSRGLRGMLPRKILKNRVSLMPFPAFWCGFLCMEQVTNEKKILRILVKQNKNRKIARLLKLADQLIFLTKLGGGGQLPPPPAPPPAPHAYVAWFYGSFPLFHNVVYHISWLVIRKRWESTVIFAITITIFYIQL